MILNLFSLPVYKTNLLDQVDVINLEDNLQTELSRSSAQVSALEKNGGQHLLNFVYSGAF